MNSAHAVRDVDAAIERDRCFLERQDPPDQRPRRNAIGIVDLFSGCGGLTYGALEGLERAGRSGTLALAVDQDPLPLSVLQQTLGLGDRQVRPWDLANLREAGDAPSTEEVDLFGRIGRGSILLAGPPCQGHSALNNHTRHDDPRNDLYVAVARAAELTEPHVVISENVGGVGSDKKRAAYRCVEFLRKLGYHVVERRLDLSILGVPQRRTRHIVVATKQRAFDWAGVAPLPTRDVAWAIGDLLDRSPDPNGKFDRASRPNEQNRERMAWLFDHRVFDLPNYLRPICHQDGNHSYVSMYGRLRWDQPAQTITSGFGSMGQGRFVHPLRQRTLTPHEAARLQCLPDFVAFDALSLTRSALATMIGNVAPPLLATRVVEGLIAQKLL